MNCNRLTTYSLSILAVIACAAFSSPKAPNYDGIRSMGMGNTSIAVSTDRTALFHNPAGLGLLKDDFELSLTPIMFSLDGTVYKLLTVFTGQGKKLSNMSQIDQEFFDEFNANDGKWAGLQYLPEFAVAKKNLGFGAYSTLPLGFRIETGHFIPKLGLRGERDLVFTWGVGIPLNNKNNMMGISLDYLQRVPVVQYITTYSETFLLYDKFKDSPLSMLGVLGDYQKVKHGAGFNVGFMHNMKGFRLGYVVRDLFGVVGGDMVVPQLDLGSAYYFPGLEKFDFVRNMVLALDIADIFGMEPETGHYEHFFKKVHAGAEIDLRYMAFRAGLNQGYPTFGVGLYAGIISLDYVYYTQELGFYPGQLPATRHVVSLGLAIRVKSAQKKNNGM